MSPTEEKTGYVILANAALAELSGRSAQWWRYYVSHRVFELLVGDPYGRDNIVLCLAATQRISGPVDWSEQRIHVGFTDGSDSKWHFTLSDESASFLAEAEMFVWRRNFNLVHGYSLYFGRGAVVPETP